MNQICKPMAVEHLESTGNKGIPHGDRIETHQPLHLRCHSQGLCLDAIHCWSHFHILNPDPYSSAGFLFYMIGHAGVPTNFS